MNDTFMTDTFWTSWGIVGSTESDFMYEKVMAIKGVTHDPKRGIPIFHGTLDEFSKQYDLEFTVHRHGRFIQVGNGEDV